MKPKPISEQMKTLNKHELEMLESVENDEWISNYNVLDQFEKRKRELALAAHNSIVQHKLNNNNNNNNDVDINININRKELNLIEELALEEGLSYEKWILNSIYRSIRYAR